MAEWLGSALQKLLQRFESASDLIVKRESPVVSATAGLLLLRVPTDGLIKLDMTGVSRCLPLSEYRRR